MKSLKKLVLCALLATLLASCGSYKDLAYFQGAVGEIEGSHSGQMNTFQSGDIIVISVSSSNPALAIPYNLFSANSKISNTTSAMNSSSRVISNVTYEGYTVDSNGNIDFPVFGEVHVAGLNREQLAEKIQKLLEPVMPDPVVVVSWVNFYVTVLGEVSRPGTYNFPGDRLTLLEAIGFAGDLTVYGHRSKVMVIREENGGRHVEVLDMKSPDVFKSPYFYLKQNDVVYVEPVATRAKSVSTFNTYFPAITSLASLCSTIAMIFYYLTIASSRY